MRLAKIMLTVLLILTAALVTHFVFNLGSFEFIADLSLPGRSADPGEPGDSSDSKLSSREEPPAEASADWKYYYSDDAPFTDGTRAGSETLLKAGDIFLGWELKELEAVREENTGAGEKRYNLKKARFDGEVTVKCSVVYTPDGLSGGSVLITLADESAGLVPLPYYSDRDIISFFARNGSDVIEWLGGWDQPGFIYEDAEATIGSLEFTSGASGAVYISSLQCYGLRKPLDES
ncbi:MAG: hypothetical protein LBC56_08090 [Oscillospiraceae bacterium]|jgi:hypothetical protein|nr:hypothetical protein [Oscillospiraceae bacterium]